MMIAGAPALASTQQKAGRKKYKRYASLVESVPLGILPESHTQHSVIREQGAAKRGTPNKEL